MVIRMLFESYGVEKYSDSHIDSTTYLLRYLKYRAPEMNETTMDFPSHTDKSFLTILHQNQVSGLEIRSRDGKWISVEFPPSSFVVMAGNVCKAWSNNGVLSPIHKVTMDKIYNEHPMQFKPFDHVDVDLLNFYVTENGKKSQDILKDFYGV